MNGNAHLTFRVFLPTSVDLIKIIPHRCAQSLVSKVILDPLTLTTNIICHNCLRKEIFHIGHSK